MELNDLILVSVDDHIVEPPGLFDNHLTTAQLAKAPKLVKESDEVEYWLFEGKKLPNIGLNAVVGRVPEEYGCEPTTYDHMRKGCYDVHSRVEDMNINGILGSICFGSFVGFEGSLFLGSEDKQNAYTLIQAYNDWHIDEWCGAYPGRFIPLAILPCWDPKLMAEEVARVRKKGCHTVSFSDNPAKKGLPSLHSDHWEPFWKACVDNDVTISCHIGSGNEPQHPSMESPIEVWTMCFPMAIALSAADWLHLPALHRYPDLTIALSEGGIGWIPYFLERANYVNEQHKAWTRSHFHGKTPEEIFRQHFRTCFIDDKFGLANRDQVGIETIMFEVDYPHSDCQWPRSPEKLHDSLVGVSDEDINMITHLNAMKAYHYDPFSILGRENCTVAALRAQATHVDVTPLAFGNIHALGDMSRPVTSGDVVKLFMPEGVEIA